MIRDAAVGWEEIADDLAKIDEILSVFSISGDAGLILEIGARDMQHYPRSYLRTYSIPID